VLAGAALVALAWWVGARTTDSPASSPRLLLGTILLLLGLSLVLHFGLFNLLAGLWRRLGADCHALFRAPLKSASLSEFWGRRWNLAFSEMTALAVFRPLRGIVGRQPATMAAFLFSGFLHELAISLPARAGYGLPLLYFALHAGAMQMETALAARASCGLDPLGGTRVDAGVARSALAGLVPPAVPARLRLAPDRPDGRLRPFLRSVPCSVAAGFPAASDPGGQRACQRLVICSDFDCRSPMAALLGRLRQCTVWWKNRSQATAGINNNSKPDLTSSRTPPIRGEAFRLTFPVLLQGFRYG
jgi:hypothetical protein